MGLFTKADDKPEFRNDVTTVGRRAAEQLRWENTRGSKTRRSAVMTRAEDAERTESERVIRWFG